MREGLVFRFRSRRPRRRIRRVAKLEGKLPGRKPAGDDPNPQTPFVLSPSSQARPRRTRTAFVIDLRESSTDRVGAPEEESTDPL